jgi:ferritin-like metal-binding protein YciE
VDRVRAMAFIRNGIMELTSLHELYIEGLRDLYSAEHQILKALPKLQKAATNPKVKQAFAAHLAQTEEHLIRLEQICLELDTSPKGKHCKGMEGLLAEGSELMKEDADPDVMDAGLISSAQHVEHYEMAGYGTMRTYAQLLGFPKQAEMLQQTLDEEQATDLLLTELALSVNVDAVVAGDDEK